jgi:phosphatidylinositol alpha-1,6-mannosyltransferase
MSGRDSHTTPSPAVNASAEVSLSPRRPDILVVTELFPPAVGGSAVLLREIYGRIPGRLVTVLTDQATSAGPLSHLSPTVSIERCALGTRSWGVMNPSGDLHHLKVAWRIRSMSDPGHTVVHCGRALPEGVAAWMSRAIGGPRYICWSHGEDVSVALTSRELTWVMTHVFRSAAAIIANSRNTRESLLALGLPRDRVHVVYPGVDPDRYCPDVDGRTLRGALLRGGDTLLLSVGRLQRRKGHDLVLEAMATLRTSLPGLRYVIVGDGDERRRLEALVATHNLADVVTFAGVVPEAALPSYFAASDVFVMPNRRDGSDIEGFGIVFLEAAASARPSIGGNSGGVPEAIDNEQTGLLVGGTDARELAVAIDRLARSPSERLAFGRAGRARVLHGFTWDAAAAGVAAIHDRVLADH